MMRWRRRSALLRRGPAPLRTPGDLATQAKAQRESLAALDRLESAARRGEIARAAIRRAIERANVPGMPTHLLDFDPAELLDIPGNSIASSRPGRGPAMSRLQFTIVRLIGVVATGAVVLGTYRVNPVLGMVLFVAAGLGFAGYLLRDDLAALLNRGLDYLGRPAGSLGLALLGLWIVTAPAVLFFDPAIFAPSRQRPHRPGPPRVLPALQRRRGVCRGLAELGSDGRQSPGAAQHAHRAELATVDVGPGRHGGEPQSAAARSWRRRPTGSSSP